MRSRRSLVDHYLAEWDGARWANAYHSLIELGPAILPELLERFARARNPAFRAALVEVARQMRSDEMVPILQAGLRDPAPAVWKEALDGLVFLASPAALLTLENALAGPPPAGMEAAEWESWLREALDQARAAHEARGGVA